MNPDHFVLPTEQPRNPWFDVRLPGGAKAQVYGYGAEACFDVEDQRDLTIEPADLPALAEAFKLADQWWPKFEGGK